MIYNKCETSTLCKAESTILKEIICLSKYCYNTELLHGLDIMNTYDQINTIKLSFFVRLLSYSYKKNLVCDLLLTMPKPSPNTTANTSLIEVISKLANLKNDQNRQKYIFNTEDLKKRCYEKSNEIKISFEIDKVNDPIAKFVSEAALTYGSPTSSSWCWFYKKKTMNGHYNELAQFLSLKHLELFNS
jgi:hypothetical protein